MVVVGYSHQFPVVNAEVPFLYTITTSDALGLYLTTNSGNILLYIASFSEYNSYIIHNNNALLY